MNVVTHLLAGWALADGLKLKDRDRELVTWSCVVPDLDGAGMTVDAANRVLGRPDTYYYEDFHHLLSHGLPAAILWTAVAFAIGARNSTVALIVFLSFHLHLLMDLAGSRGSAPGDIWPIHYLAPVSNALTFSWSGQWPLTGWQSTTLTAALIIIVMIQAVLHGASPVGLFSKKADEVFVDTLRARLNKVATRSE